MKTKAYEINKHGIIVVPKCRKGTLNKPMLKTVMNYILDHPESWDQGSYHCNTSHCFAGWVEIIGKKIPITQHFENDWETHNYARDLLGISDTVAEGIFDDDTKLNNLYSIVNSLLDGKLDPMSTSERDIDEALEYIKVDYERL